MRAGTGFCAGDPARIAANRRHLAVERDGEFQMNERPASSHEMNVCLVQTRRFIRQQASRHLDARFPQMSKATAGNFWVWIFDRGDDALDSCLDQRIGARGGAAEMRVRFQRNVNNPGFVSPSDLIDSDPLRLLDLIKDVEAFTRDLSVSVDDHCADEAARTD